MSSPNEISLLQKISSKQVEALIIEAIFRQYRSFNKLLESDSEGHNYYLKIFDSLINNVSRKLEYPIEFIYAIDTFDIHQFCFPFGFDNEADVNLEIVADEQIAWQGVFNSNQKIILLSEYHKELRDAKNYILREFQSSFIEQKNWEKLNTLLDEEANQIDKSGLKGLLDSVEPKLPLILSLALGFGVDKLEEFKNILKDKLIIYQKHFTQAFGEDVDDVLANIFSNSFPGELTDYLYNYVFNNIRDRDHKKNLTNLENDCKVIDRLLQINNELSKPKIVRRLGKRYIILLLSSAPHTFDNFHHKIFFESCPKIKGQRIDILRNNAMLYLDILTDNPAADEEKKLNLKLHQLYYFWRSALSRRGIVKSNNPLESRINELRSKSEATSIISQYTEYKQFFDQGFSSMRKNIVNEELKDYVISVHRKLKNVDPQKSIESKLEAINNFSIAYSLFEILPAQQKYFEHIKPYRNEDDHIVGINHLFPALLRLPGARYSHSRITLNHVLNLIYNFPHDKDYNKLVLRYTQDIFSEKSSSSSLVFRNEEDRLITFLMIILLYPFNYYQSKDFDVNRIRDDLINNVQFHTRRLYRKFERPYGDIIEHKLRNYAFFLVWTLRYFGKFEDSKQTANFFLSRSEFKNSFRLHHGILLTNFCLLYRIDLTNRENESKVIELYNECLSSAVKAAELYSKQRSKAGFGEVDILVNNVKTKISPLILYHGSLLNGLLYTHLFAFQLIENGYEMEKPVLSSLRTEILEKYRKLIPKFNWKIYPEHSYVESTLEYYEAQDAKEKGDIELAMYKIKRARLAINYCSNIERKRYREFVNPRYFKRSELIRDKYFEISELYSNASR